MEWYSAGGVEFQPEDGTRAWRLADGAECEGTKIETKDTVLPSPSGARKRCLTVKPEGDMEARLDRWERDRSSRHGRR